MCARVQLNRTLAHLLQPSQGLLNEPCPSAAQSDHISQMNMALGLRLEVCTGSKLKPEPGPYPRSSDSTRPNPSGTVKFRARTQPEIPPPRPTTNSQQKKRKKVAFHDCMQRNGLIKALPFHKHLPVMKVCEHQVQRSHTFCRVYEFCMDKKMMTLQIMVIFLSVKAR